MSGASPQPGTEERKPGTADRQAGTAQRQAGTEHGQPGTEYPHLTPEQEALVLSQGARAVVKHYARQFCLSEARVADYQDYLMAGYTGLIEAVRKFDPARGVLFSTFAAPYVLRYQVDLLHQESGAPVHAQDYVSRLRREGKDAAAPGITEEDLRQAATLKMRPDTIARQRLDIATGRDRPMSLDVPLPEQRSPDGPITMGESLLDAGPTPEEAALYLARRREVRLALDALSPNVRAAVAAVVFEGHTEVRIARERRVSPETVTRWLSEGFAALRVRLSHLAPPAAATPSVPGNPGTTETNTP